jgi:hypothetical protein
MSKAQKTGVEVHELISDLFKTIAKPGRSIEVDNIGNNIYSCMYNNEIKISVTLPSSKNRFTHFIQIKTPLYTVNSDMKYCKGENELNFESHGMKAIFEVIKMLLTRNSHIVFIGNTIQRSDGPNIKTNEKYPLETKISTG